MITLLAPLKSLVSAPRFKICGRFADSKSIDGVNQRVIIEPGIEGRAVHVSVPHELGDDLTAFAITC